MVRNRNNNTVQVKSLLIAILLFFHLNLFAQPSGKPLSADGTKGEVVFKANCVACHAMNVKTLGPALQGVSPKRTDEWLMKWIRNNEKFRASGDKDAIAIYNENGKVPMNVFENLSDEQIKSVIVFFKEWVPVPKAKGPAGPAVAKTEFFSNNTLYILISLIIVLLIVLLILRKTKKQLQNAVTEMEGPVTDDYVDEPGSFKTKWAYYKKRSNPTIVKLVIGAVVVCGLAPFGYQFGATKVGVQQGYAPEQPIKFSHLIHAGGDFKIDCKYCHSTAEKSKQASIPSLNTCMNCHKGVQLRERYDGEISPEIKKIYAAMDYNPDKPNGQQYGPNPHPVRWIRVHNLPDHAFFNHSMHVKGANITCQTCHGPVQEMAVIQQFATLQMGWCINCHRTRNIDVENNPYYEKLHEKIKADKNNKNSNYSKYYTKEGKINITAAQNGALECSKCHY